VVQFTVNAPPTLTLLSQTSGNQGTTTPTITLTGTNFVAPATIGISGTGVTANNVQVTSPTTITATFTITAGATQGARNVTVTTDGVTTAPPPAVTFTVLPPVPSLTTIAPSTGVQGNAVNVTLTGTNFITGAGNTTINVPAGQGITVSNVVIVSTTSITATFTLSGTATLGAQNVSVMTTGGTSGNQTFTVQAPPTLASISPTSGGQNGTTAVTLTGTNFGSTATIGLSGTGITVNTVVVVNSTTITANFVVSASAPLGAQNVTVTTNAVATMPPPTVTFTVIPPVPSLTTIAPSSGVQGQVYNVTLTGTNFQTGAGNSTINVPAGQGIAVSNVVIASTTSITATFTLSGTATLGAQNVSVTTSGGTSNNKPFTVFAPPTLASIAPTSGVQGATVGVTLTGANFGSTATIGLSGTGITTNSIVVVNSTTITASFVIAASAPLGPQNVTVTTNGVATTPPPAVTFTVNAPVPTLTSVSPSALAIGTTPTVTLTGTGFQTGTGNTTINPPAGITVSNVSVASSTSLTAMFTVSSGTGGMVTVTTVGGTSGGVAVTVGTDFTIAANPMTQTVTRPASGMSMITLTSSTPNTPFPAAVTFAVTGLPSESNCTLNGTACGSFTLPAASGNPGPNTLTLLITTTAPGMVGPRTNPWPGGRLEVQPSVWLSCAALLMALLMMLLRRRQPGRPIPLRQHAAAAVLILVLAGVAAACGGGNSGPPPNPGSLPLGPNTITITATSGNASHPAVYTLTLQ